MDQAQRLRDILENENSQKDAKIITITSGKGGVGKTNFAVNLAIALTNQGNKVTLIDADLGLANVDVMLGVLPKYNIGHYLRNEVTLNDIVVETKYGVNIISGGSGILDLADIDQIRLNRIIKTFKYFNDISDYIIIDTGAGMNRSVLSFVEAAHQIIVVVNPDPASITDAYAMIKNINTDLYTQLDIVVNRVESIEEGENIFNKINRASEKFLNKKTRYIGCIYEDYQVKKFSKAQKPIIYANPKSLASKGIENIAFNIINESVKIKEVATFKTFVNKLLKR